MGEGSFGGGAASGPPATEKQLRYLEALVRRAGHADFREARRPLGLTQRQARGRFSRREASQLIDRLLVEAGEAPPADDAAEAEVPVPVEAVTSMLSGVPAQVLADELERRGWAVHPPAT